MKLKQLGLIFLTSITAQYAIAGTEQTAELKAAREHVIHQYITDLGRADNKDINTLFVEGGTVLSTSRGTVNAQDFFNSFLTEIQNANTEFHQAFVSSQDNNHYGARFHFNFTLHNGETGSGEYVDEFIFEDNSAKLKEVYMFENLKFTE